MATFSFGFEAEDDPAPPPRGEQMAPAASCPPRLHSFDDMVRDSHYARSLALEGGSFDEGPTDAEQCRIRLRTDYSS